MYDDESLMFLARKSCSAKWDIACYCWIPYDFLTKLDLDADFWADLTLEASRESPWVNFLWGT